MGYCNVLEVDIILGQALTNARAEDAEFGVKQKLWEVGTSRDKNRIPDDVIYQYITFADSKIDGILSQQYLTPLKKCVLGQWDLDADITEYNQIIELPSSCNIVVADEIQIVNLVTGDKENHIVASVIDQYSITTVNPILTQFVGDDIVVKRVQYPPPINQVSARLAASFVYDKYFASQNAPNVSDYGNEMRKDAFGDLNNILNGKVILKNQTRVGDRFGNPWLDDTYAHRDRGYATSDRDMSRPQ